MVQQADDHYYHNSYYHNYDDDLNKLQFRWGEKKKEKKGQSVTGQKQTKSTRVKQQEKKWSFTLLTKMMPGGKNCSVHPNKKLYSGKEESYWNALDNWSICHYFWVEVLGFARLAFSLWNWCISKKLKNLQARTLKWLNNCLPPCLIIASPFPSSGSLSQGITTFNPTTVFFPRLMPPNLGLKIMKNTSQTCSNISWSWDSL